MAPATVASQAKDAGNPGRLRLLSQTRAMPSVATPKQTGASSKVYSGCTSKSRIPRLLMLHKAPPSAAATAAHNSRRDIRGDATSLNWRLPEALVNLLRQPALQQHRPG